MSLHKHLKVGIGGVKCSCCFPVNYPERKKKLFRAAKRRERREAFKIEELNDPRMDRW